MAGEQGPTGHGERFELLDALRGWALLGILIANMVGFFGLWALEDPARGRVLLGAWNDPAELLIEWLVVGKFYAIFSLLFGIGFALQMERLEVRGQGMGRMVRRLSLLWLIGLAHMLLLWFGDIVSLYALMGFALLLARRWSDRALLAGAVLLWLAPVAWSAAIHLAGFAPAQPLYALGERLILGVGLPLEPLPVLQSRTPVDDLLAHPGEVFFRYGDLLYQLRFAKVLAMFLLGLWIGRRRIYADLPAFRPLLRRVARFGLGVGLPLALARAVLGMLDRREPWAPVLEELLYCSAVPTLALGYAAAFALLWAAGRRRLLATAVPAGRMALTNYLAQSLLQSAIFLGWGLGLVGSLGLAFVLPLSLGLFALQVAASAWWLARYRFGPVEWLWRSGTYGRAQPMRRAPAIPATA